MPLDRPIILHHAFCQLNEAGPESLTLRRLATRLGVQAPALYWHFRNKQELLDEMATQVFREAVREGLAIDPGQRWEDWAIDYGDGLRRTLLRYREGARVFSGTYLTDTSLYASMDASLRKLTSAGFSLRDASAGLGTLYAYTIGFVIEEQAVHLEPNVHGNDLSGSKYNLERRGERIDQNQYPLAHAAGPELFLDHNTRFRAGLTMIVNGMTAMLPSSRSQV